MTTADTTSASELRVSEKIVRLSDSPVAVALRPSRNTFATIATKVARMATDLDIKPFPLPRPTI